MRLDIRAARLSSLLAALTLPACGHVAPVSSQVASVDPKCESKLPVFMVISGTTLDRDRMAAYSKALTDSGLYVRTGGSYLNNPRPLAVFEGTLPSDHVTLIVRFPSECAARAFWYSPMYQERIKPLRENPSAGDYSVVLYKSLP